MDGRLTQVTELLVSQGFDVAVEDDPSASRVVPRRIAIVHASRGPLPARRAVSPCIETTAPLAEAREEALSISSAVAGALKGTAGATVIVRVCSGEVCGTQQGDRPDAAVLEPLSSALAALLGVPPLRLAAGWAQRGILRAEEATS